MDAYFMINARKILSQPEKVRLLDKELKSKEVKESKVKKRKNICQYKDCKKKLSFMNFSCLCEKKFCSLHRLPEDHECTFDYKSHGRELIAKKNPLIINSKITQI